MVEVHVRWERAEHIIVLAVLPQTETIYIQIPEVCENDVRIWKSDGNA